MDGVGRRPPNYQTNLVPISDTLLHNLLRRPKVLLFLEIALSNSSVTTAANNQNSPSSFYTIYPENSNSIAPSLTGIGNSQTQQFQPIFLAKPTPGTANPLVLLGAAATSSPAESLALTLKV